MHLSLPSALCAARRNTLAFGGFGLACRCLSVQPANAISCGRHISQSCRLVLGKHVDATSHLGGVGAYDVCVRICLATTCACGAPRPAEWLKVAMHQFLYRRLSLQETPVLAMLVHHMANSSRIRAVVPLEGQSVELVLASRNHLLCSDTPDPVGASHTDHAWRGTDTMLNTVGTNMDCFLLPRCMVRPCGACRRRAVRPQCLPPEYGRDRRQIFQLIPSRANVTYEDVWCALGQGSSVAVSSHPKPV